MEKLFKRHFWIVHVVMLGVVAYLCAQIANQVGANVLAGLLEAPGSGQKTSRGPSKRLPKRNFGEASEYNIFQAFREVVDPVELQKQAELTCETDADCAEGEKCVAPEEPEAATPAKPGAKPAPKAPVAKRCEPIEKGAVDIANAVKSGLALRLVGTSVFSFPEDSLASIVDGSKGKKAEAELFSINECPKVVEPAEPEEDDDDDEDDEEGETPADELARLEKDIKAKPLPCKDLPGGHDLVAITVDRAYLFNNIENQTEYLALDDPPDKKTMAKAKKKKKKKPAKKGGKKKGNDPLGLAEGITKVGTNSYEIKQNSVDTALGNLSQLATKARIVPAFEGGQSIGFKLFSIRPGSVYSKIGIQNGDIIQKVNGYDLNSPDKALELYQKLKDGKEFSVDIKRRGKPVTLDYAITP